MSNAKFTFTVDGDPFGKERPRASRRGRFVTVYTPRKTVEYEKKVRRSFLDTYKHPEKIEGAVEADITAYHRIPKATSKKNVARMLNGEIPCTVKPDADNIAKCILDPLNGVAFSDDNHITKLSVTKMYGETPRVEVSLSPYQRPVITPIIIYPLFFTNQLGGMQYYDSEREFWDQHELGV